MKLDTILCGLELTPEADVPLAQAEAMARRTGARLVLVHALCITEEAVYVHEVAPDSPWKEYLRKHRDEARRKLDQIADGCRERGTTVEHHVADGFADEVLLKEVPELGADVVVVGTHGRRGMDRFLLGSVAERVARLAPCHVLVARRGAAGPPRNVLVATDLSPTAKIGLKLALRVAAHDAHIELFHTWQPAYYGGGVETPPWLREESQARVRERGRALAESHAREGMQLEFKLDEGDPAEAILDRLDDGTFDLVAMGSHGYRGVKRALLGSVTERVLRHAPISVLVAHGRTA
jgi:nucleotide-binding universal stress UspA family protein